ncbi:MAG: tagaturonate epimerase family protein, partial [Propionibacteriaceae bacterium]|nr:tagaturonate epimerase family protein [Propionibacteriaceae bacterium]
MTDQPTAIRASAVAHDGAWYGLERAGQAKRLVITGAPAAVLDRFSGHADGGRFTAELTADNALALRQSLPWLRPTRLGLATSAGFGDRLGFSTPGHVAALQAVGETIRPIFAQQSVREMGRTRRTPRNVLDDATWGAFEAGWAGPVGADADHLKTTADIDACAAAGFVFFTLDPGDWVDSEA